MRPPSTRPMTFAAGLRAITVTNSASTMVTVATLGVQMAVLLLAAVSASTTVSDDTSGPPSVLGVIVTVCVSWPTASATVLVELGV